MADITDPNALEHPSPGDDLTGNGLESRGTKRPRISTAGDDDDDDDEKGGRERRKIEIKFIQDKSRRHITFSKRKAGIMKKVRLPSSLHTLDNILLTITLHTGLRTLRPHRYSGPSSRRLRDWSRLHVHNTKVTTTGHEARRQKPHPSKRLSTVAYPSLLLTIHVQACLNAPEPAGNENGVDSGDVPDSPEDVSAMPPTQPGMPRAPQHGGYMTQEQQQQALYYQSLQQQGQGGQYAGMPQMPPHQRA
jgi:pheromone receptor transcription factor